jgi:ketosteroid isomerase-like protein
MKKITFLALVIMSCVKPVEKNNDLSKLESAIQSFYEVIENGDDQGRFAVYADSIFMMPDHGNSIHGKAALAKALGLNDAPSGVNYIFRIKDIIRLELFVSGYLAYSVNDYYYTYHQEGLEPIWKKTKNVHIWRKQDDGQWKMQVDI